jgi:hypothetical protein
MARQFTGRAISLIALSCAAVITALVVATVATASVLGVRHPPAQRVIRHRHLTSIHRPPLSAPAIPGWLESALMVLLIVAIAAVIILARGRRRPPDDRLRYEEDLEDGDGNWEARITADLGEAAAEQLRRLRTGDPRNAIVACWMRLQEATASAGMPVLPSETSTEFTVRALRRLLISHTAITALCELYREARFSDHPMGETARDRAIDAVETLSGQLNKRGAVPAFTSAKEIRLDSVSP